MLAVHKHRNFPTGAFPQTLTYPPSQAGFGQILYSENGGSRHMFTRNFPRAGKQTAQATTHRQECFVARHRNNNAHGVSAGQARDPKHTHKQHTPCVGEIVQHRGGKIRHDQTNSSILDIDLSRNTGKPLVQTMYVEQSISVYAACN